MTDDSTKFSVDTNAARRILASMRKRAALSEGAGILQYWELSTSGQARRDLRARLGEEGQNAEAARMIAVVDANAIRGTDPDWDDQ